MDNKDFKFRDILAFPFHLVGYVFIQIGISVGGSWTSRKMLQIFGPLQDNKE